MTHITADRRQSTLAGGKKLQPMSGKRRLRQVSVRRVQKRASGNYNGTLFVSPIRYDPRQLEQRNALPAPEMSKYSSILESKG